MTKREIIRLAVYVRDAPKYAVKPFTPAQIKHLADFCHESNPRFNERLWLDFIAGYCGPNGGPVKGK